LALSTRAQLGTRRLYTAEKGRDFRLTGRSLHGSVCQARSGLLPRLSACSVLGLVGDIGEACRIRVRQSVEPLEISSEAWNRFVHQSNTVANRPAHIVLAGASDVLLLAPGSELVSRSAAGGSATTELIGNAEVQAIELAWPTVESLWLRWKARHHRSNAVWRRDQPEIVANKVAPAL